MFFVMAEIGNVRLKRGVHLQRSCGPFTLNFNKIVGYCPASDSARTGDEF